MLFVIFILVNFFYRGTSVVKASKPSNSSGSESDKESTNSSISLTDKQYKKHPPRPSFISERRSFKVFKSIFYYILFYNIILLY